jgi:pimeloyl-ACP methyl ester carboxylesterase
MPPPLLRYVPLDAADGALLPTLVLAHGSGPAPIALLPGLSDGLVPVTTPAAQALLSTAPVPELGGGVVAFSHRMPLTEATTTRALAADAARGLAATLDAPAVLICHSMGAMVAQHLAADAPELVAALVLSATTARADEQLRSVLARWDALLASGDEASFAEDACRASFTGDELERRLAAVRSGDASPLDDAAVARHLVLSAACATHDALDRLAQVQAPTLVVAGEEDAVVGAQAGADLAAGIRGAQLVVLHGLGHGFPEQQPERFRSLVSRFLSEVVGTAG